MSDVNDGIRCRLGAMNARSMCCLRGHDTWSTIRCGTCGRLYAPESPRSAWLRALAVRIACDGSPMDDLGGDQ